MQKIKKCTKCEKVKLLTDFFKDKYKKSGYTSACKKCRVASSKKWAQNNSEYVNKKQKEWKQKNPIGFRHHQYKTRYGITIDDWQKMFEQQQGCCAICGIHQSELKKKLHVDHSHAKGGKVRGLLCGKCNLCLGWVDDNVGMLRAAISYLIKNE